MNIFISCWHLRVTHLRLAGVQRRLGTEATWPDYYFYTNSNINEKFKGEYSYSGCEMLTAMCDDFSKVALVANVLVSIHVTSYLVYKLLCFRVYW